MKKTNNAAEAFKKSKELAKMINNKFAKNEPVTEEDLRELEESFGLVKDYIELQLVTSSGQVLFAYVLSELGGIATDFNVRSLTGIIFKDKKVNVSINPLFIEGYSFKEMVTHVIAEVTRLMYLHPDIYKRLEQGGGDFDPEKFLISSDITATEIIIDDFLKTDTGSTLVKGNKKPGLEIPDDLVTRNKIREKYPNIPLNKFQDIYYYYELLPGNVKEGLMSQQQNQDGQEDNNQDQQQPQGHGQQTSDENSSNQDSGSKEESNDNGESDNSKDKQPNGVASTKNQDGSDKHSTWSQQQKGTGDKSPNAIASPNNKDGNEKDATWGSSDNSDLEDIVRTAVSEASKSLTATERGMLPGRILEQIEKLTRVKIIPWQKILRNFVGGFPVGKRKSKLKPNRRQPFNPMLRGHFPDKHIELVIAIDTSGSMSEYEIKYALMEIENILKDYETHITVIEADYEIGRIYEVESVKDIKMEVTGRGGTSFSPVINYINSQKHLHGSLLIYFTDGGGEYKLEEKPLSRRIMWLLTREDPLSLEQPYGEVKRLLDDPEYAKLYQRRY